jgi:hypothetical protein
MGVTMKVKNFSIIAFALGIIIGLCHLEPLSTMLTNYLKMSAVTAGNLLFLAVSAIFVIYLLAVRKKTALKDDEPMFKSSSAWPRIFAGILGLLLLFSSGYDILNALVPKEGPVSIPLFLTGLCALGAGIFFLLAIYLHSIGKQIRRHRADLPVSEHLDDSDNPDNLHGADKEGRHQPLLRGYCRHAVNPFVPVLAFKSPCRLRQAFYNTA